jgi:oligoendopeptidase F
MESKINGFSEKYEGIITNLEAGQLHTAIVEYESINDLVTKIASYAYLFYSTNLDKPAALSFFQNNSEVINRVSTKLLFFSLELNEIPEDSLSKAFELSEISYYKPWLDKIRALKPYQLSKEEFWELAVFARLPIVRNSISSED